MRASNKKSYRKKRPMIEINVVPYIDVMLVLLVIFMITTPILTQGVKVDLPKISSEKIPSEDSKPIVVTVDQQGKYFLNQGVSSTSSPVQPNDLSPIVLRLVKESNGKPVYVRGDENVDYGRVVKLMVLLQQSGVDKIGLVTENEKNI